MKFTLKLSLLTAFCISKFASFAQFGIAETTLAFSKQEKVCALADSLFRIGAYGRACAMYDTAFSASRNNPRYAIRQIRCMSMTEPASSAMVMLLNEKGINNSWIAADSILGPYLFNVLSGMERQPTTEATFMATLDSLAVIDQAIREPGVLREEAMRIDSLNYELLIKCFKGCKKYINSYGSILVLIHQLWNHPKDMPFMINLLNQALLDNNIDPETYANILDETFYNLYGCVPFGVLGGAEGSLPTCTSDEIMKSYQSRLGVK